MPKVANKEFNIVNRARKFALTIIKLTKNFPKDSAGYKLADQIIRSSCSVGANIVEAGGSRSKKEFISSMNISLKESRETGYWITIINELEFWKKEMGKALTRENREISNIIGKIVVNSKKNIKY